MAGQFFWCGKGKAATHDTSQRKLNGKTVSV
jgi:hypothetical protein